MIKLLSDNVGHMRSYFVQNQPNKILPLRLESPVTTCKTCSSQAQPVIIEADMHEYRLKDLV